MSDNSKTRDYKDSLAYARQKAQKQSRTQGLIDILEQIIVNKFPAVETPKFQVGDNFCQAVWSDGQALVAQNRPTRVYSQIPKDDFYIISSVDKLNPPSL